MIAPQPPESIRPVWTRNGVVAKRCPKSLLSGENLGWLDLYAATRTGVMRVDAMELGAREVEALVLIEDEHRRQEE